jgi:hypothetical protein
MSNQIYENSNITEILNNPISDLEAVDLALDSESEI